MEDPGRIRRMGDFREVDLCGRGGGKGESAVTNHFAELGALRGSCAPQRGVATPTVVVAMARAMALGSMEVVAMEVVAMV